MADKFMYGVGVLKFAGTPLGYIEKGSFKLGGKKGESSPVWAEQVQSAPVKTLPQSNGTIAPTLNLIEIDYEVMQKLQGGTLLKDADDNIIGWSAPREVIVIEGPFSIETVSGHEIDIPNGLMQSNLDGDLNMTTVSHLAVEIGVQLPADKSVAPYTIKNQGAEAAPVG